MTWPACFLVRSYGEQGRPMMSPMNASSWGPNNFCRLARVRRNWTCLLVADSSFRGLPFRSPAGRSGSG